MTKPFPKRADLRNALSFVRPGETPTLADVIAAMRSDRQLSQVRRRDMASALVRIAAACDRAPSEVFADPMWLRQQLAMRSPLSLGRSPKTRANVLSNAMAALAHAGVGMRRPAIARSAEWDRLWKQLGPSAKIALGSFARFCSYHCISPTEVTDKVVESYSAAMELASLRKKPAEALRELTVHWNRAVNLVPGWPTQALTVPNRRCVIAPSLAALPVSFRKDLSRYVRSLQNSDPLKSTSRLADVTIKHRQGQILRFVGELILSGVSITEIRNLQSIASPKMAQQGLRAMYHRKGGTSGMIQGTAYALLAIAQHYLRLPEEDIQKLREMCSKLKVDRQGMTDKNRLRLRQFTDPQLLNHLLLLPENLCNEAKSKAMPQRRAAECVETALAIELLFATALRIKNIAALHLDRNIQWSRASRQGVCHVVVDRRDVKNKMGLDFEIAGGAATLLKRFIDLYRPVLTPGTCRWLFARRDGKGPVHPIVLANRVATTIRKRTGLQVNVHLFRHLIAKVYLDANPGGYETVRQTLGHWRLSTTTSAYVGMENVSAAKQVDLTIRSRREQARQCQSKSGRTAKRRQCALR